MGDNLTNQALQQLLNCLEQRARHIEATQGDGCDCADRPVRPQLEQGEAPEISRVPAPTVPIAAPSVPVPVPVPVPTPIVPRPQPARPFGFSLFGFPPEIRNTIYQYYFADARRLLTEIAAVRVREDVVGSPRETRIRRYLGSVPRERRRFVLDHRYQPEDRRPLAWESGVPNARRERAAITYEAYADDDSLAQLPSDPLALLRVSSEVRYEANAVFLQHLRFTHPRDLILLDDITHLGILAAEAFLTDRPDHVRRQIGHIELDMSQSPPVRGGPTSESNLGPDSLTSSMMAGSRLGAALWTNGIDRLDILSNMLRQMEFRHMTLNFTGRPPTWWAMGITVSEERLYLTLKPMIHISLVASFLFNDSLSFCKLTFHRTHEILVQETSNSHPGLFICSM